MEHIKSNLKEYREGAGLSQDRLADDIGVNRKTIIAMESEDGSDPKLSTIKRILAYFSISFEQLYPSEQAELKENQDR